MSSIRATIAHRHTLTRVVIAWLMLCAATAPASPTPAIAQAGVAQERARELARLVDQLRADDPARALEHGREALRILRDEPDLELRVDVLAEMAWAEMTLGNYDEAERLATQARDAAASADYLRGQARAINNLGVIARRRGDPVRAVELFTRSLAIQQQRGDAADIAMALNNLGFVYSTDLGDFEQSLQHHMEAVAIRERLNRPADLALSLNNIGVLYTSLGEHDRALEHLERALELREAHDSPLRAAGTLSNIGEVLLAEGDATGALERFRRVLELREAAGARSAAVEARINVGHALLELGRFAEADAALREALATAEELGENRSLVRVHQRLGQLETGRGRFARAQDHFDVALDRAQAMGARHLVEEIYGMVADSREAAGDFRGALAAHRAFKDLADRNVGDQKALRLATSQALYDAERREREIESLLRQQAEQELAIERQRVIRNVLAILVLAALLGGSALYRWRSGRARVEAERLEHAARTDPLTGLDNRRAFLDLARIERARLHRSGRAAAVVVADIDRFKSFNDRHGHAVGDRVLRQVADTMRATVRQLDTVARWGGEEFVLLLPETDAEGAVVLAGKIREALLADPFLAGGRSEHLTLTFGVAAARPDQPVEEWVDRADRAMYQGKEAGRDRVVVAETEAAAEAG